MDVKVEIFNGSRNSLPEYATPFSSGVDLMANVEGDSKLIVYPGQRRAIPTGLYVAIPEGYEIQIRPRSGLALKKGITVLNTPGTIDSDYRGEIKVIIINHSDEAIAFGNGDRIAQAVLAPVCKLEWKSVPTEGSLSKTIRGDGGFGHTGVTSIPNPEDLLKNKPDIIAPAPVEEVNPSIIDRSNPVAEMPI